MPEVPTSVTALMEQQARVARKREAVKAKRVQVDAFRGLPPVRRPFCRFQAVWRAYDLPPFRSRTSISRWIDCGRRGTSRHG